MLKTGFNKFSTKIDRNAILLLQETRGKISKHFTGNLFQQNVISYINGSLSKRKISYKSALVEIMLLREIFCRSNQTHPVQWKPSKSKFAPLLPKKKTKTRNTFICLNKSTEKLCQHAFKVSKALQVCQYPWLPPIRPISQQSLNKAKFNLVPSCPFLIKFTLHHTSRDALFMHVSHKQRPMVQKPLSYSCDK